MSRGLQSIKYGSLCRMTILAFCWIRNLPGKHIRRIIFQSWKTN